MGLSPSPRRHNRKTPDIFEDVTFEHDIAAQQQLDDLLAARPTVSQSIAAINGLDSQRRDDHRSNARANGTKSPPARTGHPILDAILDEFRKTPPTPDTS